jgi:hypothetical protein
LVCICNLASHLLKCESDSVSQWTIIRYTWFINLQTDYASTIGIHVSWSL